MINLEILRVFKEGKTKVVYETDLPDKLIIKYKDKISAFNGEKIENIKKKGRICNKISAKLFSYLEKEGGILAHFNYMLNDDHMLVDRLEMIPIEVIFRNKVAGSYLEKHKSFNEGDSLKDSIIEFHIKDDLKKDEEITEEYILEEKILTKLDLENIKIKTIKINKLLKYYFETIGLDLIDFKLEYGIKERNIILGDELSPDTMRLWDNKTSKKLDKDIFREGLGDVLEGYQEILDRMVEKDKVG